MPNPKAHPSRKTKRLCSDCLSKVQIAEIREKEIVEMELCRTLHISVTNRLIIRCPFYATVGL